MVTPAVAQVTVTLPPLEVAPKLASPSIAAATMVATDVAVVAPSIAHSKPVPVA